MTGPDPGLTDLIAAALYAAIAKAAPSGSVSVEEMTATVLPVVEQHTNGRHEWPKTTPTGHTYERPTTYDELNGITADMAQGEIEGWEKTELPPEPTWPMVTLAQREIYRQSVRIAELEAENRTLTFSVEDETRDCEGWKIRAEKAEATIVRVEKLAHDMRGWCSPEGISRLYSDRIRAALEGES
ncbi:hypothetical protein QNA23_10585 [Rhodococcus erythropolis]|uniref:hypothetical protein n=1 Tax=Rhodococcus erythropolis TaxID=1833 RepID=UPI0024B8BE13|nr:hypothetical protein [Rhodococcus erythropolis]MDJ0403928.1 hypothetical protein [Rhodococcus erythropolis]